MSGPGPLEIIDRFAKAVEAHPDALPLSEAERKAVARVSKFFERLDALIWLLGWGKWVIAAIVFVATQWERIAASWATWSGP